jgi:hypothetical protein
MVRMVTCSVVVVLGIAGCRNREPPSRVPEVPPAPSSSVTPAGTALHVEDLKEMHAKRAERWRVGKAAPELPATASK